MFTRRLFGFVVLCGLVCWPRFSAAASLPGDCNGDFLITVDEIIVGVNISLGDSQLQRCAAFDSDANGAITIDELITAVYSLLNAPALPQVAFVTATDFQAGGFATVTLDAHSVVATNPQHALGSDSVARVFGSRVYVVNRFGNDNLQVLDATADFATVAQCSTGSSSNPNDIAFVDGRKAYVPLFGRAELLVVNPNPLPDCSDFVRDSIDLSAYADADGIPEMNQAAVHSGRAYVSLQRLNNFVPVANGLIAVIDVTTDTVVDTIELSGQNPFGMTKGLTIVGDSMYVIELGTFGVNDGGIERVDLTDNTAKGFIVTEATLGGDISDFVLVSDHLGYAILSLADFSNSLVQFDPSAGTLTRTVVSGTGLTDIELSNRGELFLSDRNVDRTGIRIFRASDGVELTTNPLATGLPPFDISFIQ